MDETRDSAGAPASGAQAGETTQVDRLSGTISELRDTATSVATLVAQCRKGTIGHYPHQEDEKEDRPTVLGVLAITTREVDDVTKILLRAVEDLSEIKDQLGDLCDL